MKIVIAAIEYKSPDLINKFINEWSNCPHVVEIYIASTTNDKISTTFSQYNDTDNVKISYLELKNNGYGSAMDELIDIIRKDNQKNGFLFDYLFIGNIDVFPINIIEPRFAKNQFIIPIINVIENNKNKNPFLTKLQSRFLFLYKLPLKLNSMPLLYLVIFFLKFIKLFNREPWAVHGSFFCFNVRMLESNYKYFNKSFLYCEELFYAKILEKQNIQLAKSEISVMHVGGVSTNILFKNNKKRHFDFWKESMKEYFNTK